ncbi:hypothetical protein EFR44_04720, partial [Lactobacillus delbrueckii subsp. lactis]|uniref:hypothetical protein n=1 Tax=Lactobacillus delbrueckii TaxID=1584 RepID=UPI0021A81672
TPNLTAFTGVDSQNLPDVMVSVQFILAIGENLVFAKKAAFLRNVIFYTEKKRKKAYNVSMRKALTELTRK